MADRYPQGLKKNPIRVYSPTNKQVMSFNSYREAMDNIDTMKALNNKEYRKPEGGADAYEEADKKAKSEGFKKWEAGNMGPFASKTLAAESAMREHNSNWMAKTASKKPAYNGQSNVSKLLGVKNNKAGK